MTDYIEEYVEARKKNFESTEHKKAQEAFWENAPKDIEWGKKNGLIKEMCLQDYLEASYQTKNNVTQEERDVIGRADFIPAKILAMYYGIAPRTVTNIQLEYRNKRVEDERISQLESVHTTQ